MKKRLLLFVLIFSCTNIFGKQGYCYRSKYLELYPSNSSFFFVQTKNPEQMMKIKERINNKDGAKIIANLAENAIIVNSKSLGVGNYISDIYQDKEGFKLIMLPRFAIKMKKDHDIGEILSLYEQRLSFDKKEMNVYMIDCNADNAEDVLAINKEINLLESVEWCEPMMIGEAKQCNEYAGNQYYIKNTGQNGGTLGIDINVEPVWNYLSVNTSLIVAVLDDGVNRNHEDLNGVVMNGMTIDYPYEYGDPFNNYDSGTSYVGRKAHGTACAGIIAAKDNDIGIKGVASGVKILPLNIYPYTCPVGDLSEIVWYEKIYYLIKWAYETKGADIISCSWAFHNSPFLSYILSHAMVDGRNGKGTIVVCAAGNENPSDSVCFPANMQKTIAVGAIDNTGSVWNYSCRGNTLDLVAPSGDTGQQGDVVTTDRMGLNGYNPPIVYNSEMMNTNYTQRFGGTSAACPQVAGVAALMLSANSNLTMGNVRSILQKTARKLSGMNGQNRTDAYGYGLVNAHAAVFASTTHKIEGPQLISSSGSYHIDNLPSGVTVSWSLSDSYYNNGYNLLIPNYPTTGHCVIVRDQSHDLTDATLTAAIKINGDTIQTLTKNGIYAYEGFRGHYTSGNISSDINYTMILPVIPNYSTYITSPNLCGATVSYSNTATIPYYWAHNPYTGEIVVIMPNNSNGIPIVFNIDDVCGNQYTLYLFAQNNYIMNISNDSNSITITLDENDDSERGLIIDQLWTIEVLNATTGVQMTSLSSTSRSVSISTSGWPSGIYIVKVTIGKEVYTEKVIVK